MLSVNKTIISPVGSPHFNGVTKEQLEKLKLREKAGSMRRKVVDELCTTEKTYVEGLDNLIKHFMNPLVNKIDGRRFLSAQEHSTIFPADINTIYALHSQLFIQLLKNTTNWHNDQSKIGHIFVKYGPMFKMYQNYMNNHEQAVSLLHSAQKKSHRVSC